MKLKAAQHFKAKEKVYEQSFIFVHNYGGTKASVRRHIKLVNDLGYDAFAYSSQANGIQKLFLPSLKKKPALSLHQIWLEEIQQAFIEVPGDKILFSLSYPSAATLAAIIKSGLPEVKAWVCDGGPFLQLDQCFENLYRHYYGMRNRALLEVLKKAGFLLGGATYRQQLLNNLIQLPKAFPVLSIRSKFDKLVPEAAIDEVFEHQNHLNFSKAYFSSDHLMGLRDFSADYKKALCEFMKNINTAKA